MAGRVSYYGGIVKDGLVLDLDAGKQASYVSGSTTWNDISYTNNNSTLVNGPVYTSANGGSIQFDGTNHYVSCPKQNYLANATQFTMFAWMKRKLSNSIVVIGQVETLSNDISFELWSDSNAYFEVGNGNNAFGYVSNNSTAWQYLAMVFDGTQIGNSNRLKGYVNGILQTLTYSGTIPSTTGTLNTNLIIGAYIPNSNWSNGNIAQTLIYNRALSATEILQNYNATKTRYL